MNNARTVLILLVIFFCSGTHAQEKDSLHVVKLYNWTDNTLDSSWVFGNTYNETWGFTINGREYGVIGTTAGTHFFDVTDPDNIFPVDFVQGADTGSAIIHRDYHDYNGYLYIVCDEGASTLQIVDLGTLPDSVTLVYDSWELFSRAHNIFIDTATAKLYGCSVKDSLNNNIGGLCIYSLENPLNPELIEIFDTYGTHDAYVRNDTAFLNAEFSGLFVYSFADSANPQMLGSLTDYPDKGYNHSGWLTDDGKYYIFIDENHGADVKICDVSDLNNIQVIGLFNSGTDTAVAHNVLIKDTLAYLSYYHDGLRIFSIKDPENPVQVGHYDTYLYSDYNSFRGAWGVYPFLSDGKVLISDMHFGFYVLSYEPPDNPFVTGPDATLFSHIYPNPFKESFVLEANLSSYRWASLQLYNLNGKLINRFWLNTGKFTQIISVSELPAGMYFFKVTTDQGKIIADRIIKE